MGIQPHSSQMRRNCLQGKKNNINPIVSAPRSCLKNKNKLKLQLGRFSLASITLAQEAAQWPCQLTLGEVGGTKCCP